MKKFSINIKFDYKFLKLYYYSVCSTVLVGLMIIGFLLYGPWSRFRETLVTSAMTTMRHQWLATTFYDEKTIADIMSRNKLESFKDQSNNELIQVDPNANIDDERLWRTGDEKYKVIEIKEKNYVGWIIAVYNPADLKLGVASTIGSIGQFLSEVAKEKGYKVAINASGFDDPNGNGNGGRAIGIVIQEGKLVSNSPTGVSTHFMIGFNNDNILMLHNCKDANEALSKGYKNAVEFDNPYLIVDGQSRTASGDGGWGIAPRTVVGQRKEGTVLLMVIDGRQPGYSIGATAVEIRDKMAEFGAVNASMVDGGSSSVLVIEGKKINKPSAAGPKKERLIPTWFMIE